MGFARKFRQFFAIVFILIWTHMDLYAAYRITQDGFIPDSSGQTVSGYIQTNPGDAENLFDLDTDTFYAPVVPVLIEINLGEVRKITEIRNFGHASFLLGIQEGINGQWRNAEALTDLHMDAGELSDEGWNSCKPLEPFETDSLRLQLIPVFGNNRVIRDIEIRTSEGGIPADNISVVSVLTDSGISSLAGRLYRAENGSGIIGPEDGTYADADGDNSFLFHMAFQAEQIKNAWLRYELSDLNHWISSIRTVNDQPAVGGYVIEKGEGTVQIEQISPDILRQGENTVRFVPLSGNERYTVGSVEVLIELNVDVYQDGKDSGLLLNSSIS